MKLTFRQFHWMIGAIMGVGSGKSFSSVVFLSAHHPLEICAFLMATHPWEMVNHPAEDSIQMPLPNHQDIDIHIYCGPGQGS
jgi:hypothetical protein